MNKLSEVKSWVLSKTIWFGAGITVLGVLELLGWTTDFIVKFIGFILVAIGLGIIVLRKLTKQGI